MAMINFGLLIYVNSSASQMWSLKKGEKIIYLYGTMHNAQFADASSRAIIDYMDKNEVKQIDEIYAEVSPDDSREITRRRLEANKDKPGFRLVKSYGEFDDKRMDNEEVYDIKVMKNVWRHYNEKPALLALDDIEFRITRTKDLANKLLKFAEKNRPLTDDELLRRYLEKNPRDARKVSAVLEEREYTGENAQLNYYDANNKNGQGGLLYTTARVMGVGSLKKRNQIFAKKLHESKKNTIFAAFGYAHLYGPKGVIKLLQNQGYEMEQHDLDLKFNDEELEEIKKIEKALPKMKRYVRNMLTVGSSLPFVPMSIRLPMMMMTWAATMRGEI